MSNNSSDLITKDELQEKKKIEFEQKYLRLKWRVIRYATNYFDCKERDFHSKYEARDLERHLISDMIDIKNYFKRARLEVKIVHIFIINKKLVGNLTSFFNRLGFVGPKVAEIL
ncbi:hypothetical protein [Lactococcus lactis]|uniref:hypothetical protein n=1 Tax=Lactococcus lactis TaxID=1358 RepID=UPI0022E8BAC8|nr:hypothetical protein [Lactococcus lactis]